MEWIFFDLGATLVDEREVYKSRCEYASKELNMELDDFIAEVYKMARISPTPIRAAASALGATLPQWDNGKEKLYEGAADLIASLYGKYKLGIIANQSPGTQERIDRWGIGKYFDVVVASAEAGCNKPDPEIFRLALKKAGCDPSEAYMVGDRLDNDIVPAKKLGMKTVWVRQEYAVYQNIDDESMRPDHIADGLAELKELFKL